VQASLRDPNSYALIVQRYQPALSRYVGRFLAQSSAQTDDVLQEVFLKAYVNLRDYDPARAFSPWIYRIAHNEAVSALRRHRSDRNTISGDDGQMLIDRMIDPSDMQENIDLQRRKDTVHQAIAALDPRYRDVIVLRFLEDKSYDDISEILKLPMGTVATLVSRAKQRLKAVLDQGGL
jgi:RNA polymerase sigma-70 factor, ECF subfamily